MIFLIPVLYAFLALTFVIAQTSVQICSPLFFVAVRMIIAGLLLLSYVKWYRKQLIVPNKADWGIFAVVTLLHIYFAFTLEFWALQKVSALKANFLYALTPFIAFIIELVWGQKRCNLLTLLGVAIGFCGMMPVLGTHAQSIDFTITAFDVALLCSIVSATLAWFFIRLLFDRNYSILVINGWSMLGGGILSLGTSLCCEQIQIADVNMFVACLVSLIMLSNVVIYTLYGFLISRYSMTFITTAGFLCPLFGLLYDWLLYGAMPHLLYIPAFICITIGLMCIYRGEQR